MKKLTKEYISELTSKFNDNPATLTVTELMGVGTYYRQQVVEYRVKLWVDQSLQDEEKHAREQYALCTRLILERRKTKPYPFRELT